MLRKLRLGGRVGLRNLARNRRRTAIGVATIGFGVIALLLAGGFIEWIFWAMRVATIESRLGHIQIVRQGYLGEGVKDPYDYLMPERPAWLESVRAMPDVKAITPRLAFNGLISFGDNTVAYLGEGVVPENEAVVSRWMVVTEGEGLSSEKADQIILGRGLAENLGASPGDRVVLLANTAGGGINAIEVRVGGLFTSATKAFDDAALRVPIGVAHRLLRIEGVHRWVILLHDTARTDRVLGALRERLSREGLELVPWYELADFYNKTVALFSRQVNVVQLIIGIIIVLAISNTLVMSVLERTGEIGTLLALGFRRGTILMFFVMEGAVLGVVGTLVGAVLGMFLAVVISQVGIPMPPPPGSDTGFTGEIHLTFPLVSSTVILALTTSFVASLYPAWKASRMQAVDALRHNR